MDTSGRPEDHMITSEEEFDRLPQTVKMKQDLQDPERRIALREEYKKEELPRLYPDIREELQLTAEQEGRLPVLMPQPATILIRLSRGRGCPARGGWWQASTRSRSRRLASSARQRACFAPSSDLGRARFHTPGMPTVLHRACPDL